MLFTNCYLLFVIVTLETEKSVFGNCQLSTVTLVTQKMILETVILLYCNAWENQIDFLVYHLYGLTFDEVLIVDSDTPFSREEYEAYKGE